MRDDETVQQGESLWDLRRVAVSKKIEAAAYRLFARTGVENVTVEQIAKAAKISERTFFRYFASREDILVALPARALARISADMRKRPESESVSEAFKAALHSEGANSDEQTLTLLWGRAMLRSPNAGASAAGRLQPGTLDTFREIIAERLRGLKLDEKMAGPLAAAVSGIVSYVYVQWVLHGGKHSLADALENAFDTLDALTISAPRRCK